MAMLAALLWAILCLFCAFVCFRGVRTTPSRPLLGGLALLCMLVLGAAAWNSLQLVDFAMQAYAMGVDTRLKVPADVWQLGSLVVVVKYAPLWLLGKG